MSHQPKTFVISAPSGTGKTTLNRRLVEEHPDVEISISHTTRARREKEIEGVHYYYVNEAKFQDIINQNRFLEWANVHGNLYGTTINEIHRIKNLGKSPLLEIDVQGWQKVRTKLSNSVAVFILPPSLAELWQRLELRGSDAISTRWLRFKNAFEEIEKADHYDYFIVNDDLEKAYAELESIVILGRKGSNGPSEGQMLCDQLKNEFKNADWIQQLNMRMKKSV